jgi:hypothetical protein
MTVIGMLCIAALGVWYLSMFHHDVLPHREKWELDPQGQDLNAGPARCEPPRIPYYVEISPGQEVFELCIRGTN